MAKVQDWFGNIYEEGGDEESQRQRKFHTYDQVGDGWHPLLDKIFEVLPEDTVVLQVKEKFGGLRFYTSGTSKEAIEKIGWAEAESLKICEVCGEPGECVSINNWSQTLCPKHIEEVKEGKKKWMYRESEKND